MEIEIIDNSSMVKEEFEAAVLHRGVEVTVNPDTGNLIQTNPKT